MKKKVLLVLLTVLSLSVAAKEDTTWVQVYTQKMLNFYNDFDTAVQFPDGTRSYRKIYMIFTLGKYACPGYDPYNSGDGPGKTGWCGDWDYTVQNFVMTPEGDTLEVGRLITPYANQTYARTPLTWTQRYIYDVTDFYPVLKNKAAYRIHYSGYSGGFTANVKFAFIEGTPERNVLGISRLWHGDFAYGKASDPIESRVAGINKTAPANTQTAELKFNITGHGSDNTGCSEFCKKYYNVLLNGNSIAQKDIWRDNCGTNHLYPQSGTWLYDRANWCPGDRVFTNNHVLTGVTANSAYLVDVNFQNYTGSGSGLYTVEAAVVYYGGFNRQVDASLEDIIAPSNFEEYFRENPICGQPVVRIRNAGGTPITSLAFSYGVQGARMSEYTWNGTIAPLATMDIALPPLQELNTVTGNSNVFVAEVTKVNNQVDEEADNNKMMSTFQSAPSWPASLIINMKTNTFSSNAETIWAIYDMNGNIVEQCANTASNTTYIDTVTLPPACYKLVITDAGKNGLYWWANANAGKGTLKVTSTKSSLPLALAGYFNSDFGSGFTQYFRTDWPTQIENINKYENAGIDIYPNPAKDMISINIAGIENVSGMVQILDVSGRKVMELACSAAHTQVNIASLPNGLYTVLFVSNGMENRRLQGRVIKGL